MRAPVLCGVLIAGVIAPVVRDRLPSLAPHVAPQAAPALPDPARARVQQTLATLAETCAFWKPETVSQGGIRSCTEPEIP